MPPPGSAAIEPGAARSAAPASVIGRYVLDATDRRATIELRADGTAALDGALGTWTITTDGALTISDGIQTVPATLDGDLLLIHLPDGAVSFRRDDGSAPVGATALGAAGAADPTLVGCWEDYTGSTSGAGNGQFQRTITLAADGTYHARIFVSISAGDFSSVDEDTDGGTWVVDGDSVALSSRSGARHRVARARLVPCS